MEGELQLQLLPLADAGPVIIVLIALGVIVIAGVIWLFSKPDIEDFRDYR